MIKNNKIFNILMCSRPGGDRGPGLTYGHHVKALNQDKQGRFYVNELWNLQQDVPSGDIFIPGMEDQENTIPNSVHIVLFLQSKRL